MDILYMPLKKEDSKEFFRLAGNEKAAATMRFDCPKNIEESDKILEDYISEGNRTFALRFKKDEDLWGVFAFKSKPGDTLANLSQMFIPDVWGKGLGNKVLNDMVNMARENKWYEILEGYILETNTASRKMAEKMGFTEKERHRFPGMTEDLVVYSLKL